MKSRRIIFVLVVILSVAVSCEADLKGKIQGIEQTLQDARKIGADKYASKEYNFAKTSLKNAKTAYEKGNKKQAAKDLENAEKNAALAYHNTIQNYTSSEQKLAKDSINSAKKDSIDNLAPDEYNKAQKISQSMDKDAQRLKELQEKLKKLKKKK